MTTGAGGVEAGLDITLVAQADLSAGRYKAVKVVTADNGMNLAGANEIAIGILQDKPASGEPGKVRVSGLSKAVAGATVTRGVALEVDASGRVIDYLTAGGMIGIALEAGAVNEVITILVAPSNGIA